ncbi:MAG: rhodanese family protein [Proteobacteria bacterium]|nr:rhodanese family protein [Pseudomonadota bacterium]
MQLLTPEQAKARLDAGAATLIDIRGAGEFAERRIPGASLCPANTLTPALGRYAAGRDAIFYCASGTRTMLNSARIDDAGFSQAYGIDGGLNGWSKAGLPVDGAAGGLDIQRQVQLVVGILVLASAGLGFWVSPYFLAVTAFIGCGLIMAGATGFCGMALIIAKMPWNRRPAEPSKLVHA